MGLRESRTLKNEDAQRRADDAFWQVIEDAFKPSSREMARAELELQAVEPDADFEPDRARIATAARPVSGQRRARRWLQACAGLALLTGVAFVSRPLWSEPFTRQHSFDEMVAMIDLPTDYREAHLAVSPIGNTALNSARTLRALSGHATPSIAAAAKAALARIRAGEPRDLSRDHSDYVTARACAADPDAAEAELLAAIATLESVTATCMSCLAAADAPTDTVTAEMVTSIRAKLRDLAAR